MTDHKYDSDYYRTSSGPLPYERSPHWLGFFSKIADHIAESLSPRRVLDAGCAMGFLVESLRDRGIEAWGVDVSSFAVSQVRADVRPYCIVGSILDTIPSGRFDLVTCIEVFERISPEDVEAAADRLCQVTDAILFSSTPTDLQEATHQNVRPIRGWIEFFAKRNLYPDLLFDAQFLTPQAMLFRRRDEALPPDALTFYARVLSARSLQLNGHSPESSAQELGITSSNPDSLRPKVDLAELNCDVQDLKRASAGLRNSVLGQSAEREKLQVQLQRIEAAVEAANKRIDAVLSSRIWRILVRSGQVILSIGGVLNAARRGATKAVHKTSRSMLRPGPSRDNIEIHFDHPQMDGERVLRQKMDIRGWACALTGVKQIAIRLGDLPILPVQTGIIRNDVIQHLPDYPDSDRSGFKAEIDCSQFPEGKNVLQIEVTAASGLTRTMRLDVVVDHRDEYAIWRARNLPEHRRTEILSNIDLFPLKPLITVVTPVFRTPPAHLRACIESVAQQYYSKWQHVLVDDGSNDAECKRILEDTAAADGRVKVSFSAVNKGIAAATNEAINLADGDFIAFLDHDDELSADALYEVVRELNARPDWDVLYSDEDKISLDGRHFDAFFKPDWSPDLHHAVNYICHFLVCRRSLLERVGGLRDGFSGSQDFDLTLRLSEQTSLFRRIPRILYHWRVSATSTALDISVKPEATMAGLKALREHLARTSPGATAIEIFPGHYRVRYSVHDKPRVAAIVPSGGNALLAEALQGLLNTTEYPNMEILVVDNSKENQVREVVTRLDDPRRLLRIVDCRRLPFNFSVLCNRGARSTDAPYLLFLNDDTSMVHADWLEAMVEHAIRPEVGAVGSLLLFPDDRIQHAGVLMGLYGLAGHSFRLLDSRQPHYFHLPALTRNCSAVTGACLLTRAQAFWEVEGFEERELPIAFQDVDLCLKLHERGYRIIYTPHAKLYHHESATKTLVAYPSEIEYMKKHWRHYIEDDPYYNPNLSRCSEGYTLNV
jgi:GT2 family glycosyltransferase/SAM-dependent methyltransferase